MPTNYGFTRQRHDSVMGLDYFHARYYDSLAGQFTSADTILPGGGYNILGLSRYAYVEGNPIARTDPSGHCPWCIGAVVGAVVGAGISYGSQVVGNLQRGQSLGSALTHVDVAEIGKAALVGAAIGATGGLAGAAVGLLGGAVEGTAAVALNVGSRFALGAIQGGVSQIGDNLLHGRQWHCGVGSAAVWGAATGGHAELRHTPRPRTLASPSPHATRVQERVQPGRHPVEPSSPRRVAQPEPAQAGSPQRVQRVVGAILLR